MIIDVFLPLSLIFIMFTLGIGLTIQDFKNVLLQPKAFSVAIINQMIILPIVAFCIIFSFGIENEMAVGMMILACCPGGVTSNMITKLIKGDTALSISCTAIASILTVVSLPVIIKFSMQYFMGSDAPPLNIISLGFTMFFVTTLPVSLGLYLNTKYSTFVELIKAIANKISTVLFVIIVAGALISEWETFIDNVSVLGPAIIMLITTMLSIGYSSRIWFNLSNGKASTIAVESGIQNATVGIAIGNLILSSEVGLSILSLPSGVYGILMYIVSFPFIFWFIKSNN